MMLVLRFTLENLEKLCFQRLIPKIFDETFQDFFSRKVPKNDTNRAIVFKNAFRKHKEESES